mmetsp:Transcript_11584/g.18380  ORF Transcript_11584/g.18380 Transcript_11584/m.18380 type:complete len:454 (-) Transcript_11584:15-1376(-)
MISQFYVLSLRGDTLVARDFRGGDLNITKSSAAEIFFRKVKFWHGDAPPIFNVDNVSYIFIKKNGLFFVVTTGLNVSPVAVVELLSKMVKVFKDFCGVLNEESIRKNFILIYELVDEMVDFGHPQTTNTDHLKTCVHNEAAVVDEPKLSLKLDNVLSQWNKKTKPSNAVHRPVGASNDSGSKKKNEIFVDILERLTVLMSANGFVTNSAIDGSIQMKSYLMGNPDLRLALNEDLVIKGQALGGFHGGYGAVTLDDCNFHECVDLQEFSSMRTLCLSPPDGEVAVMNYRITSGEFRAPFRIYPHVEQMSKSRIEVTIKVRADMPDQNYGGNIQITCAMPKSTNVFNYELPSGSSLTGQSCEYITAEHKMVWTIKKFQGGTEATIKCKATLSSPISEGSILKKEVGPVSLNFEIPMYNVSNLQVRYLRIASGQSAQSPCRWVRYVTQSQSYVCRF